MVSPNNPEMGGSSDRKKEQDRIELERRRNVSVETRPRGGGDGEGDPTEERGFLEVIEDGLRAADETIQRAIAPGEPLDFKDQSRRSAPRPPSDEDKPFLRPVPDEEEEPPPIVLGDPSNLGARGRRRLTRDESNASPVLRRGLLGV